MTGGGGGQEKRMQMEGSHKVAAGGEGFGKVELGYGDQEVGDVEFEGVEGNLLLEILIKSVLTYACETWTTNKNNE